MSVPRAVTRAPNGRGGAWNTLVEETRIIGKEKKGAPAMQREASPVMALDTVNADESVRYHTGMEELDRVLGGGIVPGAAILVCGDPGIGKSTVLLQMCHTLEDDLRVLYVSGEESPRQIKLRANRLGVTGEKVLLTAATDAEQIRETILENKPDIVVVDSIQTLSVASVSSSPGSVSQVRESAMLLIDTCKGQEIPLFIVGHVNKDGNIAGPKVLEHMVDTVLYFEGDKNLSYRILRANKNRFGSTNEIGVAESQRSAAFWPAAGLQRQLHYLPDGGYQAHFGGDTGAGDQNQLWQPAAGGYWL